MWSDNEKDATSPFRQKSDARRYLLAQLVFFGSAISFCLVLMIFRSMPLALIALLPATFSTWVVQFLLFFRSSGPMRDRSMLSKLTVSAGSDKQLWVQATTMVGYDVTKWIGIRTALTIAFFAVGGLMVIILNFDS